MYSKKYEKDGTVLVAACDEDLLGKTLTDGELSFEVRKAFYGDEKVNAAELAGMLKRCNTANLVGEKTVAVAKKLGLATDEGVLKIGGVPHVQILVIG